MASSRPISRRLFRRAQRVMPGGVDSPVRAFGAVGGDPPFVRRARGARITDADGRRYVDFVMSWGPLIHGHAPPGLTRALRGALGRGTSFGAPTELEVELGERVKAVLPSIELLRFVSSGTEAAMSAIRLARAATGRDKLLKFQGCYHGHADAMLVQAGSGALTLGVPSSPGVTRGVATDTLVGEYNNLDSIARLYRRHPGRIAAIIVEPVAGNMGVVPPAPEFLQGLRDLTSRHGSLLIFDEVITGFRIGPGGAQQAYGVAPDLTCLGKILGGGLPVGAYGGRADLMRQMAPTGPVYQAGTLSGNPLAMTAGLWAISHLSSRLYRKLEQLTRRLALGLEAAGRETGVPLQVNVVGSLLTPFFAAAPVRDFAGAMQANTSAYAAFVRALLDRGIYPPPSQFEAWFISGAHTTGDIDRTVRAARRALGDVAGRSHRSPQARRSAGR